MLKIITCGILALIWMFLAGIRFAYIFTHWESKKWNIVLCVINTICAIAFFIADIMLIMREVNP